MKSNQMEYIAHVIQARRRQLNLSSDDLAALARVQSSDLELLEHPGICADIINLVAVLDALGLRVQFIQCRTPHAAGRADAKKGLDKCYVTR